MSGPKPGYQRKPALQRTHIPGEQWRAVPGWEGIYEVSDHGRVYRVKERGFPSSGRILRTHPAQKGHLTVSLWRNRQARKRGVHQLVMLAFVGPCPEGMEVRHLDGDPTNNRLENLKYGTPSENCHDKRLHGTDHNVNKTHCPAGHPYSPENTYFRPRGGRTCMICKRARWRRDAERINAVRRERARQERAA